MSADKNGNGLPDDRRGDTVIAKHKGGDTAAGHTDSGGGGPAELRGSGELVAWCVFAAGVCAALHVGKLAPAIAVLQQALGLTLLQTGFLLSLVQAAGMLLGLALGAAADGLGARQSIVLGLVVLGLASVAGGTADGVTVLMLLRATEGVGLLLVLLPAPGLMRQHLPPALVSRFMGLWGAYMPLATALALLLGPLCIQAWGWRTWWWGLGGLSLAMAVLLWRLLAAPMRAASDAGASAGAGVGAGAGADAGADADTNPTAGPTRALAGIARAQTTAGSAPQHATQDATTPASPRPPTWLHRLRDTLTAPGPWTVAFCFACYPKNSSYPGAASFGGGIGSPICPTIRWQM